MVVKKKEEKENERRKFISKGGSSPKEKKEWTTYCLRLTQEMVEEIDDLKDGRTGLTRNAWILEAIQEKIKRDTIHD